jgi:phosphatidylserine decarboxylase
MSEGSVIRYYDRAHGRIEREPVFGRDFLRWAYNSRLGSLAEKVIFSRRWFSVFYGRLQARRWGPRRMQAFVRAAGVDPEDLIRPVDSYSSLSEFFTRSIDLARRPLDPDPDVCVAPCDGKVLVYPRVGPEATFFVKRNLFNLRRFLGDGALADRFAGGAMVVSRLAMSDYHHFHFPDSGIPARSVAVAGRYHAGGSYALSGAVPYYAENFRMITPFRSDHFGPMIIAEVGAMTVGSIKQEFQPGTPQKKGGHKGFFELGGSTVVLLFEADRIEFDDDLYRNSLAGLETYVRFGQSLGRRPWLETEPRGTEQGAGA